MPVCNRTNQNFVILISGLLLITSQAFGQFPEKLKNGLRYYLDKNDSARFITFNMTAQIWIRGTENNPYTTVNNVVESNTTDISIRRIRFVLSGSLTDRINFFVQFGQNNLNYLSARKAGSFFHDVTADYAVIKNKFSLGAGLNGWNGPSRFSNISIASILVLDPPGYQEVTNDTYDQFVRRLGVYAKGKLGKLDYRVSVGKPFVIQTTSGSGIEPINSNSAFSTLPPQLVYQGYFMYQFLDQESNFGPGNAGSYLGKKRVFNIGAGFYSQRNAMFHYGDPVLKDTVNQNLNLFAVDVFYDAPLSKEKGTAISVYSSFSNYNYGTNFIKVTGADNPANGSSKTATSFEKSNYGNAFPYLGTGNVGYIQTAYKFRKKLLGDQGTLQPFADLQYS
ncbi:MAG TPA: porin, partial [Cyclobacteriaceae bacterium]|nr:porin [Cyclobacteriaceae bacterium]